MKTAGMSKVELEGLKVVTGEEDPEKAYALLVKDGTLIEQHRLYVAANSPPEPAKPVVTDVVAAEPEAEQATGKGSGKKK